jgi:hypothetical protein
MLLIKLVMLLLSVTFAQKSYGFERLRVKQANNALKKNYNALYAQYPQLRDDENSACMSAMQNYFMKIEHLEYWFYSVLFYTDLGY